MNDKPLFTWGSEFKIDAICFGRTGTGKSSSPGSGLMEALLADHHSGGLILASKPEDVEVSQKIVREKE